MSNIEPVAILNFKQRTHKNLQLICGLILMCLSYATLAQENITISGKIIDESGDPIPYAAVGIPQQYIGTSSNDEGKFQLSLSQENIADSLEVSSIGFSTLKIKVSDYIDQNISEIVLKEEVTALDAVVIMDVEDVVKNALKKLRKTAYSSKHQLDMLYRRSSVENGKTRFMVEHYLNVIDYGPTDVKLDEIGIAEGRKSADYRFAFKKQPAHAVNIMAQINPLRQNIYVRDYVWEKQGYTSYDGEDIVIVQGTKENQKHHPKQNWIKFYIGLDTYAVYRIEVSRFASPIANLNAVYIYKKGPEGKLVLSYHNRQANFSTEISAIKQNQLGLQKPRVQSSYRHEAIVLNIKTDRKEIDPQNIIYDKMDIGDYEITYHPEFWKSISMPPETEFYLKSVKELESIYGVPLEKQFEAVNK
ncbi:carboxypeptidase-like regulatory domain-containing protein [Nonlabens xiamenensis]|uniref:carboxypeptidase-like regulatory domain-containing protein n=1 Tax=Nonlabens xiamenensis TaxID=2341043 RepID=UPI0013DDDB54|nr:carboxypeptidase-like regulatory domain-containing protein [Nonlabens xiamenensis]